jgi:glycosyltransferase involved in cell wall biosynthesis
MRILQINQCHYKRGGADVVYLNTINLLTEKGHNVACFSTLNPLNESTAFDKYFVTSEDVRNTSLFNKIKSIVPYIYNRQSSRNLTKLIKDFKPEIAHIHLFNGSISISILDTLKRHNIPVLHTVHDYRLLCPISSCLDQNNRTCELCVDESVFSVLKKKCSDGKLSQSIVVFLESIFWKKIKHPEDKIDYFHFVSKFCRDKYVKYFPEISKKNILIYNNSGIVGLAENEIVNKEIPKNGYYLFYGRLSVEKGVDTLLDLWKDFPDNCKLKIVGKGLLEDKFKNIIINSNIKNIELVGYRTGIELQDLIKSASFVIVPSEWYENNPMTIVESYSLGTPVIGSNMGGIPEIIEEGKTGYIFRNKIDLKNIILKSSRLTDEERREMMKNAYSYAKNNFNSEKNYYKLLDVYTNLITKNNEKFDK